MDKKNLGLYCTKNKNRIFILFSLRRSCASCTSRMSNLPWRQKREREIEKSPLRFQKTSSFVMSLFGCSMNTNNLPVNWRNYSRRHPVTSFQLRWVHIRVNHGECGDGKPLLLRAKLTHDSNLMPPSTRKIKSSSLCPLLRRPVSCHQPALGN